MSVTIQQGHAFHGLPAASGARAAFDYVTTAYEELEEHAFAAYWQWAGTGLYRLTLVHCHDWTVSSHPIGVLDTLNCRFQPGDDASETTSDVLAEILRGCSANMPQLLGAKSFNLLPINALQAFVVQALEAVVRQAVGGRRHW